MEKTVPEVSRDTGILARTLAKAAEEGRLPARKIGRDWLIDVSNPKFQEYLECHQKWLRDRGRADKE